MCSKLWHTFLSNIFIKFQRRLELQSEEQKSLYNKTLLESICSKHEKGESEELRLQKSLENVNLNLLCVDFALNIASYSKG